MNDRNITLWKQANDVYQQLMDLTVSAALEQLNGMAGKPRLQQRDVCAGLLCRGQLAPQLCGSRGIALENNPDLATLPVIQCYTAPVC